MLLDIGPDTLVLQRTVRFRTDRSVLSPAAVRSLRLERVIHAGRGGPYRYPVVLAFAPEAAGPGVPGELVLGAHRAELRARQEAELVARTLGAPLEDRLGLEPTVRSPGDLDPRPIREPDPGGPPPGSAVRPLPGADAVEVLSGSRAARRFALALSGGSLLATALAVGGWLVAVGHEGVPRPILAGIGGVEVAFLAAVLPMAWTRRVVVAIERGRVEFRTPGPGLRRRPASIPVASIESLRLERAGALGYELAVVGDDRILRIPGLSGSSGRWLRQWLAARVGRPPA